MQPPLAPSQSHLFDTRGLRKYIDAREAKRLLAVAADADRPTRLFCELLHYSGARISEALALTAGHVDSSTLTVVFRTLKRRRTVWRAVPLPASLMHDLTALAGEQDSEARLFPWSRGHAWRIVTSLMRKAGIEGPQATPRGLRHHFGVNAIGHHVPEAMLQRWMGHASPRTTSIYTFATGAEERALAKRMWRGK